MTHTSPHKSRGGLKRIWNATLYSRDGLLAAWRHEAAFRQELLLVAPLLPLGLYLGNNGIERALLVGSLLLILIVELLNSAVEAVVDRVSGERHDLSKRAKDLGSAAVMLSLLNAAVVWGLTLLFRG
ncbi:MAG: diacylglycerol kinase [Rhodocyclales bacterium]|nr:diacylglycerol kinase [Rhodocyclales bacterium]